MLHIQSPPPTITVPCKWTPSPASPMGPLQRHPSIEPSTSHPLKIHLFFRVPGKGAPSMFPNRVLIDRDTPSPEASVYLLIHSFMYVCQSPHKGALLHMGKNIQPPSTERGCRRKAYIQWGVAWFPKGIGNDTAISTTVPCRPRHDTFNLGCSRPEPH
jgi:hypothetical protein